jgi:hypothetical protein
MGGHRHVVVSDAAGLERAHDCVPEPARQRVATIFTEQSWDHVVWLPEWLLENDDKDVEPVSESAQLAVGEVTDYSEKAWKLLQPHRHNATWGDYLPKSAVVVFERGAGVEAVKTQQAGLTAFADGGDDAQ